MKNLKKLLALGLTAALTFALTACGGTGRIHVESRDGCDTEYDHDRGSGYADQGM